MKKQIVPTTEQLYSWIKQFIPEKDLFFVKSNHLLRLERHLTDVLVVPKDEFFKHPSYSQIEYINSYLYWTVSEDVEYVIVAQPNWIVNLPEVKRKELLSVQLQFTAGLTFIPAVFPSQETVVEHYSVSSDTLHEYVKSFAPSEDGQFVVLRHQMWKELSDEVKLKAIKMYAQLWGDWTVYDFPKETPPHIRKYGNSFTTISGSNCFAATLFAITGVEWILQEWVHPETLLTGLAKVGYVRTDDQNLENGDVITWVNDDNVVVHAAYHISHHLLFNKNGQVFFEPWGIVKFEDVQSLFPEDQFVLFRKSE